MGKSVRLTILYSAILWAVPLAFANASSDVLAADQAKPLVIPPVNPVSDGTETANPACVNYNAYTPKLNTSVQSCNAKYKFAQGACLEQYSPHIKTAAAAVSGLMLAYKTMSQQDACEKASAVYKTITIALTAYNAACSGSMIVCKSACGEFLTEMTSQVSSCPQAELVNKEVIPIATKMQKTCSSYMWNLAAAGAGLISTIQMLQKSKGCESQTSAVDCTNPMNSFLPQCQKDTSVDCSKAENANTVTCICQINPLATGCPGAPAAGDSGTPLDGSGRTGGTTSSSVYKTGSSLNTGTTYTGTAADFSPDMVDGQGNQAGNLSKGSAGSAGLGGGGAGGGGTAPFGAGGKAGPSGKGGLDLKSDGSNLNTNILSGYEGGGGGGSRGGSGGRKASGSDLNNYLPGAKRDPVKVNQESALSKGISGAGGKTNFQKINDRYQDNRASLLGN